MSDRDEMVERAWTELVDWCRQHAPTTAGVLRAPYSDQAIEDAERATGVAWPSELKRWYRLHNGVSVMDQKGLFFPWSWLGLIKGDHVFEGIADVQRFTSRVMALYNEVVHSVTECSAHCCPPAEDHIAVREFCEGYLQIAANDAAAFRLRKLWLRSCPSALSQAPCTPKG